MQKIYRQMPETVELTGRTVKGTAIIFDEWSNDLGGFIEKINRDALTWSTVKKSDIVANMDHRSDYIMARKKPKKQGNLKLALDERGLHFEFECPNTVKGDELLSHIQRGEYDSCSFCFTIDSNTGDKWYNENGIIKREITNIYAIHDVAVVAYPAYNGTSVEARSQEMTDLFKKLNQMENEINNIYED